MTLFVRIKSARDLNLSQSLHKLLNRINTMACVFNAIVTAGLLFKAKYFK